MAIAIHVDCKRWLPEFGSVSLEPQIMSATIDQQAIENSIDPLSSGVIGLLGVAAATHQPFIKTLLEHLQLSGQLDAGAAARAEAAQRETGTRIDTVLVELGLLSEAHLMAALAVSQGLPIVTQADLPLEPLYEQLLAPDYLKRVRMLPIRETGGRVELATPDAFNRDAAVAIAYQLERPVCAALMQPADFCAAFDQVYGANQNASQAGHAPGYGTGVPPSGGTGSISDI